MVGNIQKSEHHYSDVCYFPSFIPRGFFRETLRCFGLGKTSEETQNLREKFKATKEELKSLLEDNFIDPPLSFLKRLADLYDNYGRYTTSEFPLVRLSIIFWWVCMLASSIFFIMPTPTLAIFFSCILIGCIILCGIAGIIDLWCQLEGRVVWKDGVYDATQKLLDLERLRKQIKNEENPNLCLSGDWIKKGRVFDHNNLKKGTSYEFLIFSLPSSEKKEALTSERYIRKKLRAEKYLSESQKIEYQKELRHDFKMAALSYLKAVSDL